MILILMRHAERRHDMPELVAELTSQAERQASEVAMGLKDLQLTPSVVLTSDQNPTQATARLVFPGVKLIPAKLLNPDAESDDLKWAELSKATSVTFGDSSVIAVVGHHPSVAKLLCSVTGRKCRRIGFGEAIVLVGTPQEMQQGRSCVEMRFGTKDASELLRKKIELKMTVCTFLAGFTIPVLVELLKGPANEMLQLWRIATTIAFIFSLTCFVAGIFAFDLLLMPNEFWGPIDEDMKPAKSSRSIFALNYQLNGPLHANMVRIWKWFFTGGLLFALAGLTGLLLKSYLPFELHPESRIWIVAAGSAVVIGGVVLTYWVLRPRLGIED